MKTASRLNFALLICLVISACAEEADVKLMESIASDNEASVVELIQNGADPNRQVHDGWTAFTAAARNDNRRAVDAFLRLRVNTDVPDASGGTPIFWAAYRGNTEVVQMLLAAGADACIRGAEGKTPREIAEVFKHERATKILPICSN